MLTFSIVAINILWISCKIRGRKIQYIKLIPSNLKDQRKEILLGIDEQTNISII
jgi:hypothetical protein